MLNKTFVIDTDHNAAAYGTTRSHIYTLLNDSNLRYK